MEEIWDYFFGDTILSRVSPYVVIGIVLLIIVIYKIRNSRTSTTLIMQVLGVIIGVIVMYGIVWYLNHVMVVEPL